MKGIGIISLFLAAWMMGWQMSRSLKNRVGFLEQLGALTLEIGRNLRFSAERTGRLLQDISQENRYNKLYFVKPWADGMAAGKSPEKALRAVLKEGDARTEWGALLLSYGTDLGRFDGETLAQISQEYSGRFHECAKSAADEYRDKGRLYRALGLYAGAALAVILI